MLCARQAAARQVDYGRRLQWRAANLQRAAPREGEKKLAALEPPANARPANKHLAQALGDLADALEPVKAASSMVKAREALGQLGRSAAIKEGRAAVLELNRLGYAAAGL